MSTEFLTAAQAASRLGVSRATLYAYVSRGLIRSEPSEASRQRRYRTEDVDLLLRKKQERFSSEKALDTALHWGSPVCPSELTLIQDGQLFYRGQNACGLAQEASFEEVLELLWGGEVEPLSSPVPSSGGPVFERFLGLLPQLQADDPAAFDLRPRAVRAAGTRILAGMVGGDPALGLAQNLAGCWGDQDSRLLEVALILCADHELNVSAFTARCVASAGATPYAVVSAGLAALSGFRHGGHCHRVEALFDEARRQGARQALVNRLRRGEQAAGFGHPLYPGGDPRGACLVELIDPLPDVAAALLEEARDLLDEGPTIDFGLVALSQALALPSGSALALFALGRTGGWIAHALEQYATGKLIRPRARYCGPLPLGSAG